MGFQIFLSVLVLIAMIRLIVQFIKKHINLFYFLFFTTVWSLAVFLSWNVPLLNKIGQSLGMQRGATMLVYMALFILFYFLFVGITKFYRLEQDINKLVKNDAVRNFKENHKIEDGL